MGTFVAKKAFKALAKAGAVKAASKLIKPPKSVQMDAALKAARNKAVKNVKETREINKMIRSTKKLVKKTKATVKASKK